MKKNIWNREKETLIRWIRKEAGRDRSFKINAFSVAGILAAPTVISIAIVTGDLKIPYLVGSLIMGLVSWIWLMDSMQRKMVSHGYNKWRATFFASIAVAIIIFIIGFAISLVVPQLKYSVSLIGFIQYIRGMF